MSNVPNLNQDIHANEAQNVIFTPRSDNVMFSPPTPVNPTVPMHIPHAGMYTEWSSASHLLQPNPVHVQSPNNTVPINYPGQMYFGQTPLQFPQYYQNNPHNYQSFHRHQHTLPHNPPHETPSQPVSATPPNRNWTKEEDLQLCRAWVRVVEDPSVGTGQKRDCFWERIRAKMSELMEIEYGKTCTRNPGACQSRMNDIKLHCGKWSAIQTKAFQQPSSGYSLLDSEALARQMWEDDNNGKPFKFTACWEVLKECRRWIQYTEKNLDKHKGGTSSQAHASASQAPQDIHNPEPVIIHTNSNIDQPQPHITPRTEKRTRRTNVTDGEAACTPILNGPASVDINHPPGNKISKNPNAQKKKKLSEAQSAAIQTFRAGISSLQVSTNSRWEKFNESNKQVLLEERRMLVDHHGLDMALKRAAIVEKIASFGRQLMDAIKTADSISLESVVTPSQRKLYDASQETVVLYERLLEEMRQELDKTKPKSSPHVDTMFNTPVVGASQTCMDYEESGDEADLGMD